MNHPNAYPQGNAYYIRTLKIILKQELNTRKNNRHLLLEDFKLSSYYCYCCLLLLENIVIVRELRGKIEKKS